MPSKILNQGKKKSQWKNSNRNQFLYATKGNSSINTFKNAHIIYKSYTTKNHYNAITHL